MKNLKLTLIGSLLLAALFALNASAGEMLNWLPEVQYARSLAQLSSAGFRLHNPTSDQCKVILPEIRDLESNLLIDRNGKIRIQDEIDHVVLQIECLFERVRDLNLDLSEQQVLQLITDVLSGKPFQLTDSLILDGAKQSIRVVFSHDLPLIFIFDALRPDSKHIFGNDPCGTIKSFTATGATFELQMGAFISLFADLSIASHDGKSSGLCLPLLANQKIETLIAKAKAGDLDSAVNLAFQWGEQNQKLIGEGATPAEIKNQISGYETLILENTVKSPFLTMAASFQLIPLNLYLLAK
ncbi:hypothetical protein HYR53_04300 [Candidatus Acetothermia bacterium]|nr:hypothetical protein [Candidatus Acetothermia bacterium]